MALCSDVTKAVAGCDGVGRQPVGATSEAARGRDGASVCRSTEAPETESLKQSANLFLRSAQGFEDRLANQIAAKRKRFE